MLACSDPGLGKVITPGIRPTKTTRQLSDKTSKDLATENKYTTTSREIMRKKSKAFSSRSCGTSIHCAVDKP